MEAPALRCAWPGFQQGSNAPQIELTLQNHRAGQMHMALSVPAHGQLAAIGLNYGLAVHKPLTMQGDEGRAGRRGDASPGTVEGTICNPGKGDIRKFSFSVAEDGGVFGVTNKLWELMDA